MQLSKTQQQVLERMDDTWKSSYELRASMSTLNALESRGLVESRGYGRPGSFSMPRVVIKWRKKRQQPPSGNPFLDA